METLECAVAAISSTSSSTFGTTKHPATKCTFPLRSAVSSFLLTYFQNSHISHGNVSCVLLHQAVTTTPTSHEPARGAMLISILQNSDGLSYDPIWFTICSHASGPACISSTVNTTKLSPHCTILICSRLSYFHPVQC